MKMGVSFYTVLTVLSMVSCLAAESIQPIVPRPVSAAYGKSFFTLERRVPVTYQNSNEDAAKASAFLVKFLKGKGLSLRRIQGSSGITFTSAKVPSDLPKEGYVLKVASDKVEVRAKDYAGFFYGIQSLLQLMPPSVYDKASGSVKVRCAEIKDWPRFGWRGMMLDCSRQFFSKDVVKRYIDIMAYHKLNVFHWHLTDDDGWRLEVKKYPLLTKKGAWRGKGCVLNASRGSSPDEVYGGYYTQEDIREIVAYASERNIDILPEIDVPGHSLAVTKSYPETLCQGGDDTKSVQGVKQNTWCAGRDENFKMIEQIVKEASELFPFEYMHIGGDEVNHGPWKKCPRCQKLMKEKGMKNVGNIQNYFIRRMEKIVRSHGKKMIGWNEILHGGKLEQDTSIMSWIGVGPGIHAAKLGHKVIMAPGPYNYFDMAQYRGERGHWWAGVVPAKKTYSYNPWGDVELPEEQIRNIFGVHACLWSEFLDKPKGYLWHQTYPRLCALAEVAWTPQKDRDWDSFMNTMGNYHLKRLANLKVDYRVPDPDIYIADDVISINKPYAGADVRYTLDGSEPTEKSVAYKKPFAKKPHQQVKARTVSPEGRLGRVITKVESKPIALWEPKMLSKERKEWRFDVTSSIKKSGTYSLEMTITNGADVEVSGAYLVSKGKKVASDERSVEINRKKNKSAIFLLPLKNYKKGNYQLVILANAKKSIFSHGRIVLTLDERIRPEASITTALPTQKGHEKEKAVDWNPTTVMWVSRAMKKGETVTITFKKPVKCASIECRSGFPNTTRDILIDSVLELSENGADYYKSAEFQFGTAKAKTNGKRIKAVRIKALNNQSTWNAIQDLIIK